MSYETAVILQEVAKWLVILCVTGIVVLVSLHVYILYRAWNLAKQKKYDQEALKIEQIKAVREGGPVKQHRFKGKFRLSKRG